MWKRIKRFVGFSTQDEVTVNISPNDQLSIGYGGTLQITASVRTNNNTDLTLTWQKEDEGGVTNLFIDNLRYHGSSCDVRHPKLVINDVDETDKGVYQLKVTTGLQTIHSQQLNLDIVGDSSLSPTREESNYLRIHLLCQQLGTEAVRLCFTRYVPGTDLSNHLSLYKTDLKKGNFQLGIKKCDYHMFNNLFPAPPGTVTSVDFDFSLLYYLIRNTLSGLRGHSSARIQPPTRGWNSQPAPTEIRETDDVERIHHHRNILAHNTGFLLSNGDFQAYWTELSQAIDRLSNGFLKKKVEELLLKKFDRQTRQEIIESIQRRMDSMENRMENIERHVDENKTRHIPLIERDKHLKQIEVWKEEDNRFYGDTRMCKSAFDLVTSSVVHVIFVGASGSGKTAIARHIALKLETDQYEVVPVCNAEEIAKYANPKCKQVFVLDDVLGTFSVDQNKYNCVESYKEKILDCIKCPSKILFTCRKTVYNDALDLKSYVIENCFDLESEENALNDEEIKKIMEKHEIRDDISRQVIDIIHGTTNPNWKFSEKRYKERYKVSPMFPLLCKIYSSDAHYQEAGSEFFFRPVEFLNSELSKLRKLNVQNYTILIMCLFNKNTISRDNLPPRQIKEEIYNSCGLSLSTPDRNIADSIEQMRGTYLSKSVENYTFIHDSIFEVSAFHYGNDFPEQIIKHMEFNYIAKKIKVCGEIKEGDFCIKIGRNTFKILAERFYKEIKSIEHLWDVLQSPAWDYLPFVETFIAVLDQNPYEEVSDLFLSKEINGWSIQFTEYYHSEEVYYLIEELLGLGYRSRIFNHQSRIMRCIIFRGHYRLLHHIVKSAIEHNEKEKVSCSSIYESVRLLSLACLSGDIHKVNIILDIVPNKCITIGITLRLYNDRILSINPVSAACYNGRIDIIKRLVCIVGMDAIERMDHPYHMCIASKNGHYDVVKYLIDEGADVNTEDRHGYSPLYHASHEGRNDIVQLLIDNDASISKGCSPMLGACNGKGDIDMVKMLVEAGASIDQEDDCNLTPLHYAAQKYPVYFVRYLLEKGVDVNKEDNNNITPLYLAAYYGRIDNVQILLEKGALVNKKRSPLIGVCIGRGDIDIIKMLVEAGANINQEDETNRTPLYYAAKKNQVDVVKYLTENGADVNKGDIYNKTPLYLAAYKQNMEIIQLLLDKGASVNRGHSPLSGVCIGIRGNIDIFNMSMETGALLKAGGLVNIDIVKLLVEAGTNIDQEGEDNRTPLHYASEYNHVDVVKYLTEKEAEVNKGDIYSETPLYLASYKGNMEIVQLLLAKGASVNKGRSPLIGVCEGSGNIDIVKMLIETGEDINQKNEYGMTPIYYANKNQFNDVVDYLKENGAVVLEEKQSERFGGRKFVIR